MTNASLPRRPPAAGRRPLLAAAAAALLPAFLPLVSAQGPSPGDKVHIVPNSHPRSVGRDEGIGLPGRAGTLDLSDVGSLAGVKTIDAQFIEGEEASEYAGSADDDGVWHGTDATGNELHLRVDGTTGEVSGMATTATEVIDIDGEDVTSTLHGDLPDETEIEEEARREARSLVRGMLRGSSPSSPKAGRGEEKKEERRELQGIEYIDVMIPYTKRALCGKYHKNWNHGMECDVAAATNKMTTFVNNIISIANSYLVNSGITNKELRLAHHDLIDQNYDEFNDNDIGVTLTTLTNNEAVQDKRTERNADLVHMLISCDLSTTPCGVAWASTGPVPQDKAYSVSCWACAVNNKSFLHEVAHNMGCKHDRTNEGCGADCSGHNYGYASPEAGAHTIMGKSSSCPKGSCPARTSFLSNPVSTYNSVTMGDADNNCAATVSDNWGTVAGYREAAAPTVSPAPTPTPPATPVPTPFPTAPPTPAPALLPGGEACSSGEQCESGQCTGGKKKTCEKAGGEGGGGGGGGTCLDRNGQCSASSECCSGTCKSNGRCE